MHDMVQLGHEMLEPPVCFLQSVPLLQHRQNRGALALGDRGQVDGRGVGHAQIIPRQMRRCPIIPWGESLCHSWSAHLQRSHAAPVQAGK